MRRFHGLFLLGGLAGFLGFSGCGGGGDDGAGAGGGSSGSGGNAGGNTECKSQDASCYVAGPDGPGNECMAKADFSAADITTLRMSSHQVKSPNALAAPFMQEGIITKKSTLDEPQCNLAGSGQFNLLLELDTAQKQVTIGGGVPQKLVGAATDGTCWADFHDTVNNIDVKPETASYTESGGTFTALYDSFVMPIYVEDKWTLNGDSYVLVPLHEMTLTGKLSADKNCIGRYAPDNLTLDNSCAPDVGTFAWDPGGTYQGYITVEEADNVTVVTLGETLCVVLSGDIPKWKGPTEHNCKTSNGFTQTGALPKGDWCSTTNSAGGCQDSWQLVIDYAAQAIKVKGNYDDAAGGC
jgi:hypothetical protein